MLICGDSARGALDGVASDSVDLIFTDPPYAIGYKYDVYDDAKGLEAHMRMLRGALNAAAIALKPNGSVVVMAGDETAAETKIMLTDMGFVMRNWCVWNYNFGPACRKKFSRSKSHILYAVSDVRDFYFDADAVRVPSDRQTKYGDARARKGGKVPDDVFRVPRVCGTFRERLGWHPCQLPEAIVEPFIKALCPPGGTVLDMFAGSGTVLAVAERLGRKWIGAELSESYCAGIRARLSGELYKGAA